MSDDALRGARALVVGLGIEGTALARFLAKHGARVTVADHKREEQLAPQLRALADVPLAFALGGLDPALADAHEALYVSQGVPLSTPLVARARALGRPVRSIATLAYELFRGSIAGITGSAGKTTTTSLVSAIFTAAGRAHLLAGNVGLWPLDALAAAPTEAWCVMETSHTQLQLTTRSPRVACVTNVTPNHLDQFSWDDYVALKRNHVAHQRPGDVCVLNLDDPVSREFSRDTAARVLHFTLGSEIPGEGGFLRDGALWLRLGGRERALLPAGEVPLRGAHNVANALAAGVVAAAAGVEDEAIARGVRGFRGVPHRLERVAVLDGATYYNDSIATAPERTLAGMKSFHEPLVLLLGGRDKKLPTEGLAAECARRCRAVVTFGEAGELFARAVEGAASGRGGPRVLRTRTLAEAVAAARAEARPGDVVLLSPAGTSFDAYPNFEKRGEEFRRLVGEMEGPTPR